MIDAFRIKEALREIGKENRVYARIFEEYENLQRQKELLEKKLEGAMRKIHELHDKCEAQSEVFAEQLEEHVAQAEALKKEISSLHQEIQQLKKTMSTMVPRDNDAAKKEKERLDALRAEFEGKLRDKDEQWVKQMRKLQDEMVELKTQAAKVDAQHKEELNKQKATFQQQESRLSQEIERWKSECESKTQEIVALKNAPGDYNSLNKSKLEIVGRKKGWNIKMIPFLVREDDVDVDDLRARLQKSMAEIADLKKEVEKAKLNAGDSKGGSGGGQGGGGGDSEKLQQELEQLRSRYVQMERAVEQERNESARLRAEGAEIAKRMRDSEGDLQLLEQMREENQQMKVAMEEMRLRLAKLEQLARKNGAGKEFQEFMNECGLSEQMQSWLLQNVFERLYRDAMARHKRLEDRWLRAQDALRKQNAKIPELLHLGRSSTQMDGPIIKTWERTPEPQEVHNILMTWASVAYPTDGVALRQARVRVHELIADRSLHSAPARPPNSSRDKGYWPYPTPSRENASPATDPTAFTQVSLGRGLPTVPSQEKPQRLTPLRHKVRKGHASSTSTLPMAQQQMSSTDPSAWQGFKKSKSAPKFSVGSTGPSEAQKLMQLSSFARNDPPLKQEPHKALPDRAQTALPMAR
eukprot:gnl/MRDRNA2_/MRDRNA2_98796_c0_seq1.p1 gnl/MRDRNA2_/MRDRNA2_98796_c0~~gnl/MRDRNA2_/MRDRNA2_98796_c0_seq1.p1  ORF type:complete len:638 (-),score=164.86 gnl/MRDRNA2_/MRDRNA2_98796_c0_seq1:20-1933(-)